MESLIDRTLNYDSLDVNMKHFYHASSFKQLLQNPSMLSLGAGDANYVAFQNTHLSGTPTKLVYDTETAIVSGDLNAANSANNQLNAACDIFGYNKTINAILIQSMQDSTIISPADTAVLMNIACMDPIIHGSAVYQARAILDVDGDCAGARSMAFNGTDQDEELQNINDIQVRAVPNPNNGNFTLETEEAIVSVKVYSLTGQLMHTQITELEVINTPLKTGVYFVHVITDKGDSKILKIEVL
jgi:hypothetical protein